MLTTSQKIQKLEEAIALLLDADALQQVAHGASDVCYEHHNSIQELICEFESSIETMKEQA